MSTRKLLVPDTNILLHWQRLDQIPWRTLLDFAEIELILVSQVVRELDAKKDGESEKLSRRARSVLSQINAWLPFGTRSVLIAEGITLRRVSKEPVAVANLDLTVPDDRIIASAIELRGDTDLAIVTGDTVMRFKAEDNDLGIVTLPDSYRLPTEPSRKHVHVASPRLVAGVFVDGRPHLNYLARAEFSAKHLIGDAKRALREATSRAEEKELEEESDHDNAADVRLPHQRYLAAISSRLNNMANPVIEEPTVVAWERYIEALEAFDQMYVDTFSLTLGIANRGSAPANDVIVRFRFPKQVGITGREPSPPRRPERRHLSDMNSLAHIPAIVDRSILSDSFELDDESDDGMRAELRAIRVMHSDAITRTLFVTARAGFQIDVHILGASPPIDEKFAVNVRLEEQEHS